MIAVAAAGIAAGLLMLCVPKTKTLKAFNSAAAKGAWISRT
jgi:hypothetical protein